MSLLYLDTARLGQTSPRALKAQLDFSRLSAEYPSVYCEEFFRHGVCDAVEKRLADYPTLRKWKGIGYLKTRIASQFSLDASDLVFLANRSAQLLRLSARLMFRKCRNVLTTDLSWPRWQAIVSEEAFRAGQRITLARIHDKVFLDHANFAELSHILQNVFETENCDGIFLPAVTNFGVKLNAYSLVGLLRATGRLRFSLVDAAQSFCHVVDTNPPSSADVTIAGCHKWLRAGLPLGIAVCGRPVVAEQIRHMLNSLEASADVDDPLLRFSEELCSNSVNRYSETVNVASLFSADAAVSASNSTPRTLRDSHAIQRDNLDIIKQALRSKSWKSATTHAELETGILMLESKNAGVRKADSESVRSRFLKHDVALSTYPNGLVRVSAPTVALSDDSIATLNNAFTCVT